MFDTLGMSVKNIIHLYTHLATKNDTSSLINIWGSLIPKDSFHSRVSCATSCLHMQNRKCKWGDKSRLSCQNIGTNVGGQPRNRRLFFKVFILITFYVQRR